MLKGCCADGMSTSLLRWRGQLREVVGMKRAVVL
jgi:hypothetical protein